ncbi:phosphonate metabolism protein/1,5-bisphosphokinase (PRPP-forming) PhnN [Glaciimonas immobilis]|uniref:ribose 1,5-bisphosphate phosphokinase n=1 Tax=Glaciimonas immobilis TaxID=728004 RepID=A0A840S0X7_9BURK|nr:phosphonate metabolism protein/1,5-bisphosphokinase (PRPP-forming) PhnN [Glaciimonas immobilis]KAF3997200.1 phosphonate metabolism protein/1,5-bisphosphokinase (PRPP-forming) PhnN [Glaciimonas immobilis]MBB5202239.1 ribose 1,5-bisphosphokinase [Glaciimonas immobilis]
MTSLAPMLAPDTIPVIGTDSGNECQPPGLKQERYAIYFAPLHHADWWHAASQWLGRDAITDLPSIQPEIAELSPGALGHLTRDAQRYGFHATLKAPFRLAKGFSEEDLLKMAAFFATRQKPVPVLDIGVHALGHFLALQTTNAASKRQIGALATRCVRYFDLLRAAPTDAELSKRHKAGLSARQEALLSRWGYPYTEEEYRFHLTLTDSLAALEKSDIAALQTAADACFADAIAASDAPLVIDGLTIFKESSPGAAMMVWRHFPFTQSAETVCADVPDLPAEGRLFFVVGPSGVGKDTLLQWVQAQLPHDHGTVFARRCVTRPAHVSEAHHAMTEDEFQLCLHDGHFSLHWQANDTRYGIARKIEADLKVGRDVVINGSRAYIPQLQQLFPEAQIIWIYADKELILKRIKNRQRESEAALQSRLLRSAGFNPEKVAGITYIDNSGAIEIAGRQLSEILRRPQI